MTKRPRIQTNIGKPDKNVSITANVVRVPDSTYPVVVRPYKLDISQYAEKAIEKMPFKIKNVSEQEVGVRLVAHPSAYVRVEIPETIGPGKSGTGMIYLLEDAFDDEFEKSFTIELTNEAKSRFTVPLKRRILYKSTQPPVQAKPASSSK